MRIQEALKGILAAFPLCMPIPAVAAQSATVGDLVVIGQRYQIHSERMGETLSYQVHRPANYDFSSARYPVLIVLHGDQFQLVSTTVDVLSAAGKIPEMLVVGVKSTDNVRDEIPFTATSERSPDTAPHGGPDNFLKFITDELIPKIDRDYRTRPYRVLAGHSTAGLFALYFMMKAPDVFKGYLVLSASFGSARGLPKLVDSFLQQHGKLNADVFMAVEDATGQTLTGAWELSSYLQERASRVQDVRFTFRRYPEDNHVSLPVRSVPDGLLSIFDGWQVGDPFKLYEQAGLTGVERNFSAVSSRLGYSVPIPSETLVSIFVALEGLKRFPEAEQVIKRALGLYPNDATLHYYAGRLYRQMGNDALATEYLKVCLLMSPTRGTSDWPFTALKIDAKDVVPEVHLPATQLNKYLGSYGTSAAVLQVLRQGDRIVARTADRDYDLRALSDSRFFYADAEEVLTFKLGENGQVLAVSFQNGGAQLAKLR